MIFIPKLHCLVAFWEAAVKKCRHQVKKNRSQFFNKWPLCFPTYAMSAGVIVKTDLTGMWLIFPLQNSASHTLHVIIKRGQKYKWQRQKETRGLLTAQHHLGVDGESEHSFRHQFLTPCSYLERTPASHEPDCSPAPVCSPGTALLSSPRGLCVSFCA